jgi:6,7-dimethyl-8-ribityllumazine synthase
VPVVPEPQPSIPVTPEPEPSQEPSPEPTIPPQPEETEQPEEPAIEPEEPVEELSPIEPEPIEPPVIEPIEESITSAEELPEEISPELLMQVDLAKIVPTELSEAQVEALIEAALETFETAEQGSEEYIQALEALFVAAQADDIVLNEALAAIPLLGDVLGGATELINFLGNAGADMSPQVREDSEKVVVTAIVAVQAALSAISISGIATTINIRSGA